MRDERDRCCSALGAAAQEQAAGDALHEALDVIIDARGDVADARKAVEAEGAAIWQRDAQQKIDPRAFVAARATMDSDAMAPWRETVDQRAGADQITQPIFHADEFVSAALDRQPRRPQQHKAEPTPHECDEGAELFYVAAEDEVHAQEYAAGAGGGRIDFLRALMAQGAERGGVWDRCGVAKWPMVGARPQ